MTMVVPLVRGITVGAQNVTDIIYIIYILVSYRQVAAPRMIDMLPPGGLLNIYLMLIFSCGRDAW